MTRRSRLAQIAYRGFVLGLIAALLAPLWWVAWAMPFDYYDAFDYLRNARAIVEPTHASVVLDYHWRRPPLLSLLQALTTLTQSPSQGAFATLRAAHLLAWLLSLLALLALSWQIHRHFDRSYAWLGVLLVGAAPMFLHLVPFALTDVPAMLFSLLAIETYLAARATPSRAMALACALSLAAAMATKYNLMLLVPAFALFEALRWRWAAGASTTDPHRTAIGLRLAAIMGLALLVSYGLHVVVYARIAGLGHEAFTQIVPTFLGELAMVSNVAGWDDPLREYVQELFQVTSFAMIAAALAGALLAIRDRRPADCLHLLWLVLFLGVMTFGIGTKSSRYLLPILPSLAHLQLRGVAWAHAQFLQGLARRSVHVAGLRWLVPAAALACLLWLPLTQARDQLRHFDDPIYRDPFLARVVDAIEGDSAADAEVFWAGNVFSIYPAAPVFFPHDETFYFYHFGPPALSYLLGRPVDWWLHTGLPAERILIDELDANAVIVFSDPAIQMTHLAARLPSQPRPLLLRFVDRVRYAVPDAGERDAVADPDPSALWLQTPAGDELELPRSAEGFSLPEAFARGGWSVYEVGPDGHLAARPARSRVSLAAQGLELVRVRSQRLSIARAHPAQPTLNASDRQPLARLRSPTPALVTSTPNSTPNPTGEKPGTAAAAKLANAVGQSSRG